MFEPTIKSTIRRSAIREKRSDRWADMWREFRASEALRSLEIAAVFCVIAIAIVMLRDDVIPYRVHQYVPHDILSRVDFKFVDKSQLDRDRQSARDSQPRVYKQACDLWGDLQKNLLALPDRLAGKKLDEIEPSLRSAMELDGNTGALSEFLDLAATPALRSSYEKQVKEYVAAIARQDPVVVSDKDFTDEWKAVSRKSIVTVGNPMLRLKEVLVPAVPLSGDVKGNEAADALRNTCNQSAHVFPGLIGPTIVAYTVRTLRPNYEVDEERTAVAQNRAADDVPTSNAIVTFAANQPIFHKGVISERDWQVLRAEKQAFVSSIKKAALKARLGMGLTVLLISIAIGWYVVHYQIKIVRNPMRTAALCTLLVAMLLLAQIAGVGGGELYLFGLGPTIFVTMILTIAYDQRFAIGISSMHGIVVTAALDQGVGFFLILWVGILATGFMLNEIRSRGKLIEVGAIVALAMAAATVAFGSVSLDPLPFILHNCMYAAGAGLGVGFIVLGILPFIERWFKITTGMTLLEVADISHPLLRRLSLEAPGTYNHSLQVATLAEAAADAIGANSLEVRVAAYYHDIGKINKAQYFAENQTGQNRHIHLTPQMSQYIITGHVKDGIALAREYKLPTVILPYIQQHHGTTLIEYFFDKAKKLQGSGDGDESPVTEEQFRYAGPKPRSREIAILMLADTIEAALRAEREPSHNRIEQLVHDLSMKRLLDGQFDECDLTMRELATVQKVLVKTLTGIYHGRIAYPASASKPNLPISKPAEGVSGVVA